MEVEGVVWAVGVWLTIIRSSLIDIDRGYRGGGRQIAQWVGWSH